MRTEAMKALAHGNPDLAERALNRERQANKIFVLLLRLIFTAYQNPNLARAVGLASGFPLVGYRSVAKNLELTADHAQEIAEICLNAEGDTLDVDASTMGRIRDFTADVDEITALAVRSVVERDYDLTIEVRRLFREIRDTERELLASLPEMPNAALLEVREVLVGLRQTAEYAVRNAEIAANLALDEDSEHVAID
jgi:phosphate uptake regulator